MNKKILLAEDDSNLGTLLRNYLDAKNYETTLFVNGKSALKAFSTGKFDLCILDIMMPEMDGLTLAKAVRNFNPDIPNKRQILLFRDQRVSLTTKESELLDLLYQNRNQILERNFALKSIWIDDNYFNARSMDVYITRLRKYFRKDPSIKILNVHGKGYKLLT
jgi:DNA-binding response OmpR family regulator